MKKLYDKYANSDTFNSYIDIGFKSKDDKIDKSYYVNVINTIQTKRMKWRYQKYRNTNKLHLYINRINSIHKMESEFMVTSDFGNIYNIDDVSLQTNKAIINSDHVYHAGYNSHYHKQYIYFVIPTKQEH